MQHTIHKKNIELSDHQEHYLAKKVDKILSSWRALEQPTWSLTVTVERMDAKLKQESYTCHIVLNLTKKTLSAEDSWISLEEAIDKAEEKILSQIRTYESKYIKNKG